MAFVALYNEKHTWFSSAKGLTACSGAFLIDIGFTQLTNNNRNCIRTDPTRNLIKIQLYHTLIARNVSTVHDK
ncbi:hypothetical protein GCM10009410_27280 [Shewanella ulleungensis]|uniref:Uncharacterized protein n=1 Tax=Shewanella ulleungensis TaxID=2282699 RepID=A0ABQ2QTH9_9GAMM|nr:hypothetical protein GCM10009410_27280 [Shewanella ulleungensis]